MYLKIAIWVLSVQSLGSRPEYCSYFFIDIFEKESDWFSGLDNMWADLGSDAHFGPCLEIER